MKKNLLNTILNAVAVAMGIAVIVMNILDTLTTSAAISLLSLGLAAVAIAALQK
jgi:hypothetical protein